MLFGSIVDPGYKIALFLHILAVVLAFGPTFGYAFFFSVAPQYPQATPAILAGVQKVDKYLVNPGMIVLLLAGIGLLSASDGAWDRSDAFVGVGFFAIIALFGAAARVLPAEGAGGESARRAGSEEPATRSARSSKRSATGSARSGRWRGSSSS